jgi:hypothetical protein
MEVAERLASDFVAKNHFEKQNVPVSADGVLGFLFGTSSLEITLRVWPENTTPDPLDLKIWPSPFGAVHPELFSPKHSVLRRSFLTEKVRAHWHLWSNGAENPEQVLEMHATFMSKKNRYGLRLYSNSFDFPKDFPPHGNFPEGLTWDSIVSTVCAFIGAPPLASWKEEETLVGGKKPAKKKTPATKKTSQKKPAKKTKKTSK